MYKFIDDKGTFTVKNPLSHQLYFPLTNSSGTLLASISPNLAGDIKHSDDAFITPPASIEDIRSNLLCRRDFFLDIEGKIISLAGKSCDSVECGFLYHKISKTAGSLTAEIINFIPHDLEVEVMWIRLINESKKNITFTPTSFIPLYGRKSENIRDHRHVSSLLNRLQIISHGIYLKPTMVFNEKGHSLNTTTYFSLGWEENSAPPQGQFPTLDIFCGQSDLISPEGAKRTAKPLKAWSKYLDGKEAAAAFRFKTRTLAAGKEAQYCLITGFHKERTNAKALRALKALNTPKKVQTYLDSTKSYWQKYNAQVQYDLGDAHYNNWLAWVKFQPTLRKLFGCSFLPHFDYGKGGRGWRDLWQDALALLTNEPSQAKKLILESFKGVRIDGSNATIIAKDNSFLSDRNNISRVWMDHAIWPYITLRFYIHTTGDMAILMKDIPYFQDHLFSRGRDIDKNSHHTDLKLRTGKNEIYQSSLLEHVLLELLVPFFNVGEHNIIRLENADWNDGLDMAPERGESTCFTFMYAHHLNDICFFLKQLRNKRETIPLLKEMILLIDSAYAPIDYGAPEKKQQLLDEYYRQVKNISGEKRDISLDTLIADLTKKSNYLFKLLRQKEWLGEGFYNGYYDNSGRRVEGKRGKTTHMLLASQVFAIMSGTANNDQIPLIWKSIQKYLKNRELGGFRLNTDFKKPYTDLGRAFGFTYGDKENGACFNHMTVMLAYALYQRDFKAQAWEALDSTYRMSRHERARIYPLIPEYFNGQGRGLYSYLTGSASWYMHTLREQVLGIKPYLGDIILEPKLNLQQFQKNSIGITFSYADKRLTIEYIKPKQAEKHLSLKKVVISDLAFKPENGKFLIKKSQISKLPSKSVIIKAYF